ncbi:MAG: type II toxin-antitoxin system PemK/MazF family toxin [Phormidesmis sp.]
MKIERGEVLRLNLNPTLGREQSGNARPCVVLSNSDYNTERQGIVIITPVTSTIRPDIKMMIPIPSGFKAQGSVIAEQIRTVDLSERWWRTTGEVLPKAFIDRIVDTFGLIVR